MSNESGNALSGRSLKRMELEYKGVNIKFAINPTDYTQNFPNRATLTQTKGGAWIDAWGAGIVEFNIKGVTGVKGNTKDSDTGYARWRELEKLFDDLYNSAVDGAELKDLIKFYNYTDNEYYYCYPTQAGLELYRSASKPHLYQYTISLWGIRKIGQPSKSEGTVGNPNKSKQSGKSKNTTVNQTSTYKGGEAFTTGNRNFHSETDRSTKTSTRTKTDEELLQDCENYAKLLEPLIGGKGGKISPPTGYELAKGISIQSSGLVSNVSSFRGGQLTNETDLLIQECMFTNMVSYETYLCYQLIKDYSDEILSPAYSNVGNSPKQKVLIAVRSSKQYDSTILEVALKLLTKFTLTKDEFNCIKVILLESITIYQTLYKAPLQDISKLGLSVSNFGILIRNLQAIILQLSLNLEENENYQKLDLILELRNLEKIITQISADIVHFI